ncbi:signal recognition particle 14 kDa protein-like isoform X2 [Amaranthus tricolor]|uniref:signal recognition particle 14 kDa protein-like isoform X2 n=1 Tax=Amaranthus tricolor TaxID=29722 RepID=UPI002588AD08|nr:signal recognition particle 14 kDa protein-like isoform X2 [Amaranthus tricolor]
MPPSQPRNRSSSAAGSSSSSVKAPLNPDSFLTELTAMFERSTEKGSVWVTLKRSSMKSKVQRNKMKTAGVDIDYRCLIRATDGKKTISTTVKFWSPIIQIGEEKACVLKGCFFI